MTKSKFRDHCHLTAKYREAAQKINVSQKLLYHLQLINSIILIVIFFFKKFSC